MFSGRRLGAIEGAIPWHKPMPNSEPGGRPLEMRACECGRVYTGRKISYIQGSWRDNPEEKCPDCMPEVRRRQNAAAWAQHSVKKAEECMKAARRPSGVGRKKPVHKKRTKKGK